MYTDYQAEAHFLVATGELTLRSANALHPAPALATERSETKPLSVPRSSSNSAPELRSA